MRLARSRVKPQPAGFSFSRIERRESALVFHVQLRAALR
jgi:hypothetical protein